MKNLLPQNSLTLLLFIFMLMCLQLGSAQDLEWVNGYTDGPGSLGAGAVRDMKVDGSGNVYIAGGFSGTVDFDPGVGVTNLTSAGSFDIYISKLDASGNLLWAHSIGGVSNDGAQALALDASGNVYLTGWFQESNIDFNPGAGTNHLSSFGALDTYVLKLNSSGIFQWAYQAGGVNPDQGNDLAVDASGNVYVTGYTREGDFDNTAGTTTLGENGGTDIFVVKLNSSGTFQWGRDFGGTGKDEGVTLELESSGDIFVGGIFSNTVDFDPSGTVENHVSNGSTDAFLIQLDASGNYQSTLSWGGTANDGLDDLAFTSLGSVVLVSYFDGVVDVDPYAGTNNFTAGSSNDDVLVQLLDVSAGSVLWADQIDIADTPIMGVNVDNQDIIHIGGFYSFFGFYYSYDITGTETFSKAPVTSKRIYSVEAQGSNLYLFGAFTHTVNFDLCSGSTTINASSSSQAPFIAKYGVETEAEVPTVSASSSLLCGSQSVTLTIGSGNLNDATDWQWYSGSCGGVSVGSGTSVMVSPTTTTTYFVRGEGYSCLTDGNCASITITVSDPPTDISISSNTINEGLAINTTVGSLSTMDATSGDTHTYSRVKGAGDDDNASFVIVGNKLRSNEIFDFEVKNTYSIRVRSEDALGCTYEEAVTISVNNVIPEAPTDISLDNSSINENESANTVIGTFSTTDDDTGETYNYSLVSGTGDDDNALFSITNDELANNSVFDFETKSSYTIRVETNDSNGGLFEKQFTISVDNINETESDILSFSIPEQVATPTINSVTHEVAVEVAFGTDKSSLAPTFTISSGAASTPNSGVSQNFNAPIDYTITAEDGTDQIWSVSVNAPIPAGTYTVGIDGDYSNFTNAVSDLNNNGISGDVTLEILNSQSTAAPFTITNYFGSSDHTLTIVPTAGPSSITFTGRLELQGVENITIDGMGVLEFSADFVSLLIESDGSNIPEAITVRNSQFTSRTGIWITDGNNITIDGNVTRGLPISGAAQVYRFYGIALTNNTQLNNLTIQNNDILFGQEFNPSSIQSSVFGIAQTTSTSITGYFRVYNNTIRLNPAQAKGVIRGLGATADDLEIYHNTILLEGGNGSTANVECVYATAANSARIKNNILDTDVTQTGASITQVGIHLTNSSISTVEMEDNNITFLSADRSGDGYIQLDFGNALDEDDLATIQSSFPGTTFSEVNFVDSNNGDLKLTGTSLDDPALRGNPVALVTTDFDGTTRSTLAPTKGAFEHVNVGAQLLGISFPEQRGDESIDEGTFTVDAVAEANADITDLSPMLTLSAGATANPTSGSSQDFSSGGISYTVSAETGGASQAWTVNITEFNETPSDIALSASTLDENQAAGTVVGNFSTTDANTSQSHTYSLVAGSGDTGNGAFEIEGNQLKTLEVFDFETTDSYDIRLQTDDGNGGLFEKIFTINITNVFEAPTDLLLSATVIDENNSVNATIGTLSTTDEDAGEAHTYSLVAGIGDTDNASFNVSGNLLRASEVFSFESKNSYTIRLQTDDGNGGIHQEAFTITINDVAEAPSGLALTNAGIQENNGVNEVIGTLSTTDDDAGETFTYALVAGSGDTDNASFNISGSSLRASSIFDFETQNSFSIRIQTDDGNGGTYEEVISISVTNEAEAPTNLLLSSSGIDESSPAGSTIGNLSTTDEDNGETYTYSLVNGTGDTDNASFSISGNELQSNEIFDFETKTSYTVRIETNDGNGGLLEKSFTININNLPPGLTGVGITSSSVDENLSPGSSVGDLFALGDEIDGVSFSFTLVSGSGDTDNGQFSVSSDALLTSSSFDFESMNQYSIRVMADDGAGSTIEQIILIDVNDVNEAPTDIALSNSSVPENSPFGTLIGTLSATDEDAGQLLSFQFSSNPATDNTFFDIENGNELVTKVLMHDYEIQDVFLIEVEVNDGQGGQYEETISISITDQNDDPTALTLNTSTIDENNSVNETIGAFSTTDQDAGDSFTYSFVSGSGDTDNASFSITGNQLQAGSAFDFEVKSSYSIRVQTSDGNGGLLENTFTITVNDVNENPTGILLSNASIEESNPAGSLVGTLSSIDEDTGQTFTYSLVAGFGDTDNASFSISDADILSAEIFDFETKASYSIRVQTNDENGGTYEEAFTISITDLPASITSFTLSNSAIDENISSGTTLGTLSTAGEDLSGSFTYTLVSGSGDEDNSSFTIAGDQLLTAESFDFETQSSYSILVMTDDGNQSDEQVFIISVNDISEAPTALLLSANTIDENNAVNDVIGSFSTTDEDAGETHTYSFVSGAGDDDNASFSVAGNDLQAGIIFDFETKSSYSIRVETNDGNGGTFEEAFTISVNDLDENAVPVLTSPLVDYTTINGVVLATRNFATAFTDPDGDAITLTATSSDESVITVEFDGFTLRMNEVGIGQSEVTVTANDGNGGMTSASFTVTIEFVAQAPPSAIALSQTAVNENSAVSTLVGQLSATDANVYDEIVYSLVAGTGDDDNSSFAISGLNLRTNAVLDFDTTPTLSIRVQADDQNGGTLEQVFTITVNDLGDNAAPTVATSLDDLFEEEGFSSTQIDLTNTFTDTDADALTVTASSSDENVVTVQVLSNDQIQINEVGLGTATITVIADDGNGGIISDEFIVTVSEAPNSAPTVVDPLSDQTSLMEGFVALQINYGTTFQDADSDDLTISVASSDETVATVEVILNDQIQINEVGLGTATITVTADDGNGGIVSDEFIVTVSEAPNSAPTVVDPLSDQTSLMEGFVALQINYGTTFQDADGDDLTISVASSHETVATVEVILNDQIQINEVGLGTTTITVTADDGNGGIVSDEFTVTVSEAPNSAPTVVDPLSDQTSLVEGFDALQINYSTTFDDADGDDLTISVISSDQTVVAVTLISNNQIQIDEVGIGTSTITVTADDGNGGMVSDEFIVTVSEAPNNAPTVINPFSDASLEEGFATSQISFTNVFEDIDGDDLIITVSSSEETVVTAEIIAGEQIQMNEVGIGTSTITVTADDGNGGIVSDTFNYTVTEKANTTPVVINAIVDVSEEEGFRTAQLSFAKVFSDADEDELTVTVASSHESVVTAEVIAGDQIQISEVGIGTSTITVTADDGNGGIVSDTFTFEVIEAPLGFEESVEINIYPNPVLDFLKIKAKEELDVTLTTVDGKELEKANGTDLSFDLRSLGAGVYLLTVNNGTSITHKRIVKAN